MKETKGLCNTSLVFLILIYYYHYYHYYSRVFFFGLSYLLYIYVVVHTQLRTHKKEKNRPHDNNDNNIIISCHLEMMRLCNTSMAKLRKSKLYFCEKVRIGDNLNLVSLAI